MLIAFPQANGIVLTNLYLPTVLMLIGLIIRGVSFDFRAKAKATHKAAWDKAFTGGSFLMAISQGYMIGSYVLGFEKGLIPLLFSLAVGLALSAAYRLIGASWLILKTEGKLQKKAVDWARSALKGTVLAIVLIAIASPIASQHVFSRWVAYPDVLLIMPVPLVIIGLVAWLEMKLRQLPMKDDAQAWAPFAMTAGIFFMCLFALGYSFYPYIVPGQLKIVEAASAHESLLIILVGALAVLPFLIGYTIYAYKVFAGKTRELTYN
jgi:cytochrome d ubiquinol oxidase subunit II